MNAISALIATALSLLLLAIAPTINAAELASFTAHYDVYARGLAVGDGRITLEISADGRYQMRSAVAPSGLAALLVSDDVNEQANGQLTDSGPIPAFYRYRQTGRRERSVDLHFDWRAGVVDSRVDGESQALSLTPGVVDPLTIHLQVMWALENSRPTGQFTLVNRHRLRTYTIADLGNEPLRLPSGAIETKRFSRQRPGSSRRTDFWLAPSLDHLPAQIVQYKKDKENLRMTLRLVER